MARRSPMARRSLQGTAASPGAAYGAAWRYAEEVGAGEVVPEERREQERDSALAALASAAEALTAVAATLPRHEAEIVETGVLMAQDPALAQVVEKAILSSGLAGPDAILLATAQHADVIAALGDEMLAARADDIRSLGRRAARLARGSGESAPCGSDLILIARDIGPADIAELAPALAGVALAGGGATAHAAIVARSLGIPMVTGIDARLLEVEDGVAVALDGSTGSVVVDPDPAEATAASDAMRVRRGAIERDNHERSLPAVTTDGRRIAVLANVASPAELSVATQAGAEGIGLLRTELAFLEATGWPSEQQHLAALEPILADLHGARAIVRVLDFGADKAPPFLHGIRERGLELLLSHADAFLAQLRAILTCSQGRDIRIMLPLVDTLEQLDAAASLLEHAARQLGVDVVPPLGAMIETPTAAENAPALATRSQFFSIGTNDLTASTLGENRFAANAARAHNPRVLRLIARSVEAAHAAGITIEVCGEAASDPLMIALLVGLGVDELSAGAARVGQVRRWIRLLSASAAEQLARQATAMSSVEEVERAVTPLADQLLAETEIAPQVAPPVSRGRSKLSRRDDDRDDTRRDGCAGRGGQAAPRDNRAAARARPAG